MKRTKSLPAAVAVAAMAVGGLAPVAAAAEPCLSGADVRAQISELVAGLTDDVRSDRARAAAKSALVESLRTYRGQRADSAEERQALGQEIAALASRQAETENRVEGRALAVEILALTEQREKGRFTAEERAELRDELRGLRRAAVARTSSDAEAQAVADAFKALHEQFACKP